MASTPIHQSQRFPWRVLWFLLIASLLGAAAGIPFALEVFRPLIQASPPIPMPLPLLVLIGGAQNLLLLGVVIGIGLLLGKKIGLGAPLLERWLYYEESPVRVAASYKAGAPVGIAVGVIVTLIILS